MRRRQLAATLATAVVLLGACGGGRDDDSSTGTTGATSSTTLAPTTTSTVATTTTVTRNEPVLLSDSSGPREVADRITAADAVLHAPGSDDEAVATAARHQQAAFRSLAIHPDWIEPTAALVEPRLRDVVRDNGVAGSSLRSLTKPRPSLPSWRIVTPAPATELEKLYRNAEYTYGVPWNVLAAVHLVETRMGRIRGTSTAGAQGPMQFLPSTWKQYGEGGDINDNRDAIRAAARYLKRNGAPSRIREAVYAYNHSDAYVEGVMRYAARMAADPGAYRAYWHWQVFYRLASGDVMLPEGWAA
ncbi:MAG TPA: lytic murein transglycosylase [Acidimicrobiales bacterium]|nr:lytic murein transglycosylase [Acidimicrobiales bacterium]